MRVVCGHFEHQRRVQFEGCEAEPLRTITAILPGSKWSCLFLRIVSQDAMTQVTQMYQLLRVFVGDIVKTGCIPRGCIHLFSFLLDSACSCLRCDHPSNIAPSFASLSAVSLLIDTSFA